jgi:hypothetical protein
VRLLPHRLVRGKQRDRRLAASNLLVHLPLGACTRI